MKNEELSLKRLLVFTGLSLFLTMNGWAQTTETILYTFTGGSDGGAPYGNLIADGSGNLYGTTSLGGTYADGVVFELTPNPNGTWSEQVLHSFAGNPTDGSGPFGGLVFDSKGNLYGTTMEGGNNGDGIVFELIPAANNTWDEKILYHFKGGTDAASPSTGLTRDAAGNLYGTTDAGGTYNYGTVFELVAAGDGTFSEKVLYSFRNASDGGLPSPTGQLAFDALGNLYGTTVFGGAHDYGAAFQLRPNSNGTWTEKVIHSFTSAAGAAGNGGFVLDKAGNLYVEGAYSLIRLVPSVSGAWSAKILHTFTGTPDGADPLSGLFIDQSGSLYGTTQHGGRYLGAVFKVTPGSNGTWSETVLHRFTGGIDGDSPWWDSLVEVNGNLYGTTSSGGSSGFGVAFQLR